MKKRLTKSSSNRMVGGVIAGVCEYFGFDDNLVTIFRIVYALVAFMSVGSLIIAYLVLWAVLPEADKPYQRSSYEKPWENHSQNFYQSNPNKYQTGRKIKEAEPVGEDENWSDF